MKFSNIVSVKKIGRDFFEISFNIDSEVRAGQFLMVWVPGVKEIPMSVSNLKNPITISFKAIGETTKRLSAMRPGDRIFYRGPYGNTYPDPKGKTAYVAGGTGIASLLPLISAYPGDVYYGMRTAEDIVYKNLVNFVSTDDGSMGFKGNVVDLFIREKRKYDTVFVCGPEPMMKYFHDKINRNEYGNIYYSLERLMKCGVGICDSCSINGFRVCRDGTVFDHEQLNLMDEFGTVRRAESGRRIFLK